MEITTLVETDDRTALRSWMEKNHQTEREVWVATYRGRQPMADALPYVEVVEEALLKHLAQLAVERNCGRMEWISLDWNQPALKVYRGIGAIPMDEWTVQRLDEMALKKFAEE